MRIGLEKDFIPISIHTLLAESDPIMGIMTPFTMKFQSTPSSRRVTKIIGCASIVYIFQSTPSSRRVTRRFYSIGWDVVISIHTLLAESDVCICRIYSSAYCISIHTLLAESDVCICRIYSSAYCISIHTLLAESDVSMMTRSISYQQFQSTPSSRRVTTTIQQTIADKGISIHTLLAESDRPCEENNNNCNISIHTLLAESDRSAHIL